MKKELSNIEGSGYITWKGWADCFRGNVLSFHSNDLNIHRDSGCTDRCFNSLLQYVWANSRVVPR
jgi:hypothetical protein